MGCSACQNIKTIEEARIKAQIMANACQENYIIYKKYLHGIGYTFGYSEQGRKLERYCSEIEVVQFQQPESESILSDNGGEQLTSIVPKKARVESTKRKSVNPTE